MSESETVAAAPAASAQMRSNPACLDPAGEAVFYNPGNGEDIVVPREDDIVIPEKLSYIVVIIDELADLMMVQGKKIEDARIVELTRTVADQQTVASHASR